METPRRDEVTTIELERAILGGIIEDPSILSGVIEILNDSDFLDPTDQKIFRVLIEMQNESRPIDYVSVYDRLGGEYPFDVVGNLEDHALPSCWQWFSRRLKEYARRREAKDMLYRSVEKLGNPVIDLSDEVELLSDEFLKLMSTSRGERTAAMQSLESMKKIDASRRSDLIQLGFPALDQIVGGMMRGQLWLIAGRTSMGKSAFSANLAIHLCEKKETIAYLTLEGTNHQLFTRMVSIKTGISYQKILRGDLDIFEREKAMRAFGEISEFNLKLLDDRESRWEKIKASIRSGKLKDPRLSVVFVDYIGLCSVSGVRDLREEIEIISCDAKALAQSLDIVVVIVAQLNRQVETRPDHHPRLSDLRESGALEQDADVVLLLYRPVYYDNKADPNEAEIAIAKNREGAVGSVKLTFDPPTLKFS